VGTSVTRGGRNKWGVETNVMVMVMVMIAMVIGAKNRGHSAPHHHHCQYASSLHQTTEKDEVTFQLFTKSFPKWRSRADFTQKFKNGRSFVSSFRLSTTLLHNFMNCQMKNINIQSGYEVIKAKLSP
jgi:hypothetical protein